MHNSLAVPEETRMSLREHRRRRKLSQILSIAEASTSGTRPKIVALETESISSESQIRIVIRIMSKIYRVVSNVIISPSAKFHQNLPISS